MERCSCAQRANLVYCLFLGRKKRVSLSSPSGSPPSQDFTVQRFQQQHPGILSSNLFGERTPTNGMPPAGEPAVRLMVLQLSNSGLREEL